MLGRGFLGKIAGVLVARVLSMALGMLFMVVVARVLGPEGRGLYAVIVAIIAMVIQFGNFGLHASSVYFVSRGGRTLLPSLMGNAIAVAIVVGVFGTFFLSVLSVFIPQVVPLDGMMLALVILAIPAGLLLLIFQNLLLGLQLVRQYNVNNLAVKLVSLTLLVIVIINGKATLPMVYMTVLIGTVVGVALCYKYLYKQCNESVFLSRPVLEKTFSFGIKAYLAALFSFMVIKQDLLMVKYFMDEEHVGYYSIAGEMAEQLMLLATVVCTVLFPTLSAMNKQKHRWHSTKQVLWYTSLVVGIIVSIAAFLSELIITLLFGDAYVAAIYAFQLLMPGIWFLSMASILQNFMGASGHAGAMVCGPLIAAVMNFVANIILIKFMGIEGAALASSMAYALFFITSSIMVRLRGLNQ